MTIKVNCIGYPRIGPKRELKNALEKYWKSEISEGDLLKCASELKKNNWQTQKDNGVDYICSNDFSFYDQVLDTICLVGSIPERYKHKDHEVSFKTYFAMARGSQTKDLDVPALEMTKWFDTNYHYLVPEFSKNQKFKLSSNKPFDEFDEAKKLGFNTKPIILGPLTFLSLGKTTDETFKSIDLLDNLLPVYAEILSVLNKKGAEWIQIDEPILVKNQNADFTKLIKKTLNQLKKFAGSSKIILTTYFEKLDSEIEKEILESDVDGIHLDLIRGKISNINSLRDINKTISIGIIDGRNIWKSDVNKKIEQVLEYSKFIKNLWISSSCPLLHTPYDLGLETKVPEKIRKWLSFSKQKLIELNHIKISLNKGNNEIKNYLDENKKDIASRVTSELIHDDKVKQRAKNITTQILNRKSNFIKRSKIQTNVFNLPLYPTTTIGSLFAIAILAFLVWAHHMFVTGLNPFLGSVFVLLTLLIAVPSAIKVFNWLTTLWRGNIRFTPGMLFAIGFVSLFISGGLTGIWLGNSALDIHCITSKVNRIRFFNDNAFFFGNF